MPESEGALFFSVLPGSGGICSVFLFLATEALYLHVGLESVIPEDVFSPPNPLLSAAEALVYISLRPFVQPVITLPLSGVPTPLNCFLYSL